MLIVLLRILLIGALITAALPLLLILSQWPTAPVAAEGEGLTFDRPTTTDAASPPEGSYSAADGTPLPLRQYESTRAGAPVLILAHGSSWHSLQFDRLARGLADAGVAHVAAPDLRGHGFAPDRRGDIDRIDQLTADMAALMADLRARHPGAPLILGGHSSGGGLVVRYAGSDQPQPDGYLLLAPFLQYNAPTTRPNSGGWARPLTRRIIGLTMLNAVGIRALNHLTAIEFAVAPQVLNGPLGHTLTRAYSYRLNRGYAPHAAYTGDIAALKAPFLLLAGADDDAFIATEYEPLMRPLTNHGQYRLLPGVTHLGVVDAPESRSAITAFLAEFPQDEGR